MSRSVRRVPGDQQRGSDVGVVAELWVHPVKSLAGQLRPTVEVGTAGVTGDRAFVVRDACSGEPVRPRTAPQLAGIAASGNPDTDTATVSEVLGRAVRVVAAEAPQVDVAAVHLVSRQARERAAAGEVPDGCSADDPRANLVLDLPDADERDWVGRRVQVGGCELEVIRLPKHCLGVYAEVRVPGRVSTGDLVRLQDPDRL